MEQSVHFTTVAARDLDAARRFYVDALGWKALLDVPGEIIFFQVAPGLLLGFFDAVKFAEDLGAQRDAAVSGVTLSHNVGGEDEVRSLVQSMRDAGATVLKEPQPGSFGGIFHAHVEDPNGLVWEIAHNPTWRIADDGSVVFG